MNPTVAVNAERNPVVGSQTEIRMLCELVDVVDVKPRTIGPAALAGVLVSGQNS